MSSPDYGSGFDLGGYSDIGVNPPSNIPSYSDYLAQIQRDYEAELAKYGQDTPYGSSNENVDASKTVTNKDGSTYFYNKAGEFLGGVGASGQVITGSDLNAVGAAIKNLLGGTGNLGAAGSMLAFGGIGALLNKLGGGGGSQPIVGYQGGIPKYTVARAQTPMAEQRPTGYRPGQGGITYFTPIQYTKTGQDIGAAPVTPTPATGGTTGGSNVGVNTSGSVATPGYTGPVTVDGQTIEYAAGGYMPGGIAMLAGGRYLRGAGDGVSDSIPARFEQSGKPARLADGEFVIDARTVSEIGNGSSEAGARKLYAMMDRVHKARKTAQRGKPSGADKFLPK